MFFMILCYGKVGVGWYLSQVGGFTVKKFLLSSFE